MAVIHRTYRLDTLEFHKTLKQEIFIDGVFYPEKLREYAKELLAKRSSAMDEALILMRFDEEWLEPEETPDYNFAKCYLIALAAFLKPNHKARPADELFRFSHEFLTLRMVLQILRWSDEEIQKISRGNNIKDLFKPLWSELTKDDLPKDAIQSLWQSGVGYLGKDEIAGFLLRLESHGDFFLRMPLQTRFAIKIHQLSLGIWNDPNLEEEIRAAYYRATEVLSEAKQQKLDLILIQD